MGAVSQHRVVLLKCMCVSDGVDFLSNAASNIVMHVGAGHRVSRGDVYR